MSIYATLSCDVAERDFSMMGRARLFLRHRYLNFVSGLPQKLENEFVRCIYCHYVCDDNVQNFDEIIKRLSCIGNFITSEQLYNHINGKVKLNGRNFHLSFDDGLKNNFTNAAPVLLKYSIPATFFVSSEYIGATYKKASEFCSSKTHYRDILELMTWEDLHELMRLGFEIGSHSISHARLSLIHDELKLRSEIFASKRQIESHLGEECKYFSWPYGGIGDINERSLDIIRDAGYLLNFGGYRGSILEDTQICQVPRHHFEPSWPLTHVEYFARGNYEKT